jgi:glucose-1-phosphate cytidylyltransferase
VTGPEPIDTVILCGGRGTRAYPDTRDLPKPLLEVGDQPIVDHVMDIYVAHGFRSFVLAAGYRVELFRERYGAPRPDRSVRVVDTGPDSGTGRRIASAGPECAGSRFFATYGDGVGDVDLAALLAFHRRTGAAVTVTTVPLPSQYGTLVTEPSGRVLEFREKPRLPDHWINAGFFVFEKAVLDQWPGEDLERDVLPTLADRGLVFAYRHTGFWKSMDTYKDRQELNALAAEAVPPWTGGARPVTER